MQRLYAHMLYCKPDSCVMPQLEPCSFHLTIKAYPDALSTFGVIQGRNANLVFRSIPKEVRAGIEAVSRSGHVMSRIHPEITRSLTQNF